MTTVDWTLLHINTSDALLTIILQKRLQARQKSVLCMLALAGSRDVAFVGAVEILSLRLRLRTDSKCMRQTYMYIAQFNKYHSIGQRSLLRTPSFKSFD